MNKSRFLIGLVILIGVAGGCASMSDVKKYLKPTAEVSEENLDKQYLQKGKGYERKGDLVAAYKQYKLAIAVNPSNEEAIKHRHLVAVELRKSARKHYNLGLKSNKEGKYSSARRQFLIALRLWPYYPEAVKMLTSRKRTQVKRYVVHKIKPGESLSKVAKTYYGDYKKFTLIANYNNIEDVTKVEVGQEIKIPKLEGIKLLAAKKKIRTEAKVVDDPGIWAFEEFPWEAEGTEKTHKNRVKKKKEEPVYQVAIQRDHGIALFSENMYQEASVEFKKVLNVYPEDKIALKYAHEIHFQQAEALFEKEDYLAARDQFKASIRYKKDCKECRVRMKESEDLYKEMHYKKGIQYFGKELLVEAIEEWKLVKAVDPKYKRAEYLIDKANTILDKIEKLRQSQIQ